MTKIIEIAQNIKANPNAEPEYDEIYYIRKFFTKKEIVEMGDDAVYVFKQIAKDKLIKYTIKQKMKKNRDMKRDSFAS